MKPPGNKRSDLRQVEAIMLCGVRFVLRIDGLETGRIERVRREGIMG